MCHLVPFQSEVRLAEDYDVYISKAQLDSILVNYTRSGSLLFRKLVGIYIFISQFICPVEHYSYCMLHDVVFVFYVKQFHIISY